MSARVADMASDKGVDGSKSGAKGLLNMASVAVRDPISGLSVTGVVIGGGKIGKYWWI
jgi:hypothetical protein